MTDNPGPLSTSFRKDFQQMPCDLGLLAPKKYETNLSNEVLNMHFGWEAAKISKVKDGVQLTSDVFATSGQK